MFLSLVCLLVFFCARVSEWVFAFIRWASERVRFQLTADSTMLYIANIKNEEGERSKLATFRIEEWNELIKIMSESEQTRVELVYYTNIKVWELLMNWEDEKKNLISLKSLDLCCILLMLNKSE